MNGKKGSFEINIPAIAKGKTRPETGKKSGEETCFQYLKDGIWSVWVFCKEDTNRVVFALKVGLAVLLVSLLILFRAPYEVFGATFNRGFNRALGSLLAGILAIGVAQLALRTGRIAEPVIIGISIFIIGTVTSFMKQWPSLVQYEYGFRVILFTYCLIIVSGYRMGKPIGNPIPTSMSRLYSIAIGGIVAVLVNVLILPIWAGEQLHKELAVAAKWEPPHGRFRHFFYPWSEYVKVSAVLRYCAYEVMALHGVLHSEIQAPYNLIITFQTEIQDATSQAAELVRSLGKDVSNMERTLKTTLLKRVHSSTERLQRAIDMHSYLLTSNYDPPDNPSKPLPKLSHTLSSTLYDLSTELVELEKTTTPDQNQNPVSGALPPPPQPQAESYHEMMRKQSRRLYSWPSREVDAFEEEGGFGADFIPRMKALESTAALSLATFTSLLIEFVARLDHLVEAVDELSKMAKFKHEVL
ncbi:hypothetical protein RHGRI_005929 [Rhododendron griersonianum]|uniref:Aluminum-activated malate transporter n=1 Tax=Rhododendron griersonianum TaxID=479676 RepID=A0AAV6LF91_9ERIC|nr:hypothetical protein RHGRI_005929 [Rhododendron griersonianum]